MHIIRSTLGLLTALSLVIACGSGDKAETSGEGGSIKGAAGMTPAGGSNATAGNDGKFATSGASAGGDSNAGGGNSGDSGAGGAPPNAGTGPSPESGGGESPVANGGADAGMSAIAGNGGSADGGALNVGGAGPAFHVFLLLGQSNMSGYAKAQAEDKVEDPRVQVLGYDSCGATGRQTDQWDIAAPPLHECWTGAVGPGDWFAKTLLDVIPEGETIGLVPCAISGAGIDRFLKEGGDRYDWIVQRAKRAQDAGGVIEGILFHQGETNNTQTTWPGKVSTMLQDLKADLGLGDIPFLAGELAYDGDCAAHNTQIAKLPDVITDAHVVSAEGLTVDPADTQWNVHFGHDSSVTLGLRYAEKMIEVLGW